MTQQTIIERDPSRNKFATTSFVLSLVSIILSPIIIIQILGIVFGIKGLKSEKKGLSIAGLVINSLTIIILPIIAIVAFSAFSGILNNAKQKADFIVANQIQTAIVEYITNTNDFDMTFGESETPSVERIISKLQQEISFNGKTIQPLLENNDSNVTFKPLHTQHKGWQIIIDKSKMTVEVSPSTQENELKIEE